VPPQYAALLLAEICEGLQHAHERGVLHRDIKPSNVLLDPVNSAANGRRAATSVAGELPLADLPYVPRIADFGLARLHLADERATRTSAVIGTAAYMSPEQALGRPDAVGPASDIYSVGALFYEVLTGRPPIEGNSELDLLRRLPTEEPVSPRRIHSTIARDLETICLKCLEKNPDRRYASARELADDLYRFLRGEPIQARPVGPMERSLRWCRRNVALAALIGSIVTAVAVLAVVVTGFTWKLQDEVHRVAAAEREGKHHLWDARLAAASGRRQSGVAGQRLESLEILERAVTLESELGLGDDARKTLRDDAIGCLALYDLRGKGKLGVAVADRDPRSVAIDATFSRAVVRDAQGVVSVVGLRGEANRRTIGTLPDGRVAISANGRCAAAFGAGAPLVWTDGSPRGTFRAVDVERPAALAISESGDTVAVISADGTAHVYSTDAFSETRTFATLPAPRGCAFDASGKRLAVWANDTIAISDVQSGDRVATFVQPGGDQVQAAALSPDGRWLVSGGDRHHAYTWSANTGSTERPVRTLRGHQGWVNGVAFAPDGYAVATTSLDGTTRLWEHWTGRPLVVANGRGLRFHRDGARFAAIVGDELADFEYVSGQRRTAISSDMVYEAYGCAISPDSRLAASWSFDGVRLWDVAAADEVGKLCGVYMHWAQFRRHGDKLALVAATDAGVSMTDLEYDRRNRKIALGVARPVKLPPQIDCFAEGAVSGDGKALVAAGSSRSACVVRLDSAALPVLIEDSSIGKVAISPDGRFVVSYRVGQAGIAIWKAASGALVRRTLNEKMIYSAAFGPDGTLLAVDTGDEIVALGTPDGRERTRVRLPRAASTQNRRSEISFAEAGGLMAVSGPGNEIALVDWSKQSVVATMRADLPQVAVCLSPDGSRVACTGADLVLQFWNLGAVRSELSNLRLSW
jgi:WD40 repeat protein